MFTKNTAGQFIFAQMNSRVDGSPLTSSVSVATSIDGGSNGAGAGTLTHLANGSWRYAPLQAETNGEMIRFQFTHASGIDVTLSVPTMGALPNAAVDSILDRADGVESGVTLRQAQRVQLAAAAGKLSGAETPVVNIRDTNDTVNRISANVDGFGNRTGVTLNLA